LIVSMSPITKPKDPSPVNAMIGDMETIKRSGKNVTVILNRNDSFGWIRGEAVLLDEVDEPWSTDFDAVDYVRVAEGFGFEATRITSEAEIEPVLANAIANSDANFIEIRVPTQDKVVPFVPSWVRAARSKNLPYFS
ncbi:MAG: thiamine pyrophosphate-dependent enzyme, partial [Pseudomonadota bacterium]